MMMSTHEMMTSSSYTTERPPDNYDVNICDDDITIWRHDTAISVYTCHIYLVMHWWRQHRRCFLPNSSTLQLRSLFHQSIWQKAGSACVAHFIQNKLWITLFETPCTKYFLTVSWSSTTDVVVHSRRSGLSSIIFSGEVDNILFMRYCAKDMRDVVSFFCLLSYVKQNLVMQ